MQLKKINVQDLLQATSEYNPRKDLQAGDKEYEKLKKSIQEFGYVDPIIFNETTGQLVGGHQRLKILHELGYEEVDVSIVELTETQEKALNLTLNKSGGEWDNDKLKDLLDELVEDLPDLEVTGFTSEDLDNLVREMDFQNTMNGSFLDSVISEFDNDEGEELEDFQDNGDDSYNDEEPDPDIDQREEYFTLKYPVSYEDRDIVMEAIALAKRNNLAVTSPEAIVAICDSFIRLVATK